MPTKVKLTSLKALAEAAECLKTLAHPHRLRMVQMLLQGRFAVGELAEACEIPSHMASEHLKLMQRLVSEHISVELELAEGLWAVYADPGQIDFDAIFAVGDTGIAGGIGADVVAVDPDIRRIPDHNAGPVHEEPVAGDHVALSGRSSANEIARRSADVYAVPGVAQRKRAAHVASDEIPSHDVATTARSGE